MEIYYGIDTTYTGKSSDKYIEINNFGYYKNIDVNINVNRAKGRPDYQLIYIKSGEVILQTDKGIKKLHNAIILFRPNQAQVYTYTPAKNSEYMWIHFSGIGAEEILSGLFDTENILKTDDAFTFANTFESIKNFCIKYDDISAQFAAGSLIKMMAQLKKSRIVSDNTLNKVIELMRTQGVNLYSNEDYAKMCGISEYHFIRRFKKFTGMTPLKYQTKSIVERGIYLLQNSNMNVSEIAFSLGFNDSLYFSRMFKKATGVSPIAYRNNSI